jgi:hypothetical protein
VQPEIPGNLLEDIKFVTIEVIVDEGIEIRDVVTNTICVVTESVSSEGHESTFPHLNAFSAMVI